MSQYSLILVLLAALNSCIGNLLIKKSRLALPADASIVAQFFIPWFLLGIVFYVINLGLFAKALDTAPVSVAYPILATSGFALLVVLSHWLFGERINGVQGVGLVLAVAGITLLARGG